VYGDDFTSNNFLCSILKDAVEKKEITLKSALESEKDYINITDVVDILPKIAVSGSHRLYNIASGVNVSNKTLIELATKATGCKVSVAKGARSIKFPTIDIKKAKTEFAFSPTLLQHDFDNLVNQLKDKHE
jgi:dTDP-D-glucose 4,6-dehydratase